MPDSHTLVSINLIPSFQTDHLAVRGVSEDRQRAQLRLIDAFRS